MAAAAADAEVAVLATVKTHNVSFVQVGGGASPSRCACPCCLSAGGILNCC
ncbi:hypothetical protein CPC08DRAFT_769304 [Agrocybe pediades]|nr:hypothetical protein CPC08DRAFT_769304 [Agrocybe pediades]